MTTAGPLGLSRLDKIAAHRHNRLMNRGAIGLALAAFVLFLAGPALATEPEDSVACTYAAFSPEDREIALLLIAQEIAQGGDFSSSSRNVASVDALIEEGLRQCRARFGWNTGRADAARNFTLTTLLGDVIAQSLQAQGRTVDPVERFYQQNAASRNWRLDTKRLAAYLAVNGWDEASEQELVLADLYIDALAMKDQARRRFAASAP